MSSKFHVDDQIKFVAMTPDGPLKGEGKVRAIKPAGISNWLHILQEGGSVRMLFEATSTIELAA